MATPGHPLRDIRIKGVIEEFMSDARGNRWEVKAFTDMNEFSSHPSAILSNGSYSVFVKLSTAANGLEQFETELAGLRLLSELAGILIPTPIANLPVEGGTVMVLEAVRAVERTPKQWRQIGQTLAQIHHSKGSQLGLETHNYFGPLYQDNRPLADWPTFYAERRLWPRFMGAINSGHMPTEVIPMIEKLISRLPALCGPGITPTLLHGDAQQNNFISTAAGPVVIDPAVYYGHPEMDLAYIDYFRPVPADVLNAYRDVLPIDPGFPERRELWRVYGYLAVVEVEGAAYLPKLIHAVREYL
jgi:protein-ribulosamine 3-kinase